MEDWNTDYLHGLFFTKPVYCLYCPHPDVIVETLKAALEAITRKAMQNLGVDWYYVILEYLPLSSISRTFLSVA
jgi:hypothetical protein